MTWDELRNKISAATGRPPEAIPNAGTPEFYALLTDLETSHPDLAHEITQWLLKPYEQPVPRTTSCGPKRAARTCASG